MKGLNEPGHRLSDVAKNLAAQFEAKPIWAGPKSLTPILVQRRGAHPKCYQRLLLLPIASANIHFRRTANLHAVHQIQDHPADDEHRLRPAAGASRRSAPGSKRTTNSLQISPSTR